MNDGMIAPGPWNDNYETPPWLFKALDTEFGFTRDAAADMTNHLCDAWVSDINDIADAGCLIGERVYCNPPYSMIEDFVAVALGESSLWVLLLPSRTGTRWFQRLHESSRVELRFLQKRIKFYLDGQEKASPRLDSLIAVVRPRN